MVDGGMHRGFCRIRRKLTEDIRREKGKGMNKKRRCTVRSAFNDGTACLHWRNGLPDKWIYRIKKELESSAEPMK